MIPELKKNTEQKMQKTLESLKTDFGKVRTGRARLLDVDDWPLFVRIDQNTGIQREIAAKADMPLDAVAEALDLSVCGAKMRVLRALRMLRVHYGEET